MIIHWGIGLIMGTLIGMGIMCLLRMAKEGDK
jgi:hypothetical protein